MGPILKGLIKLQSVENRLRVVTAKLTRCRRSVIFQENLLRTLQNTLEAKKEEILLTKIQLDRLELELKSRDEYIAKYRAALNLAKTNKEYSAILTELNTNKADNSKLESDILELMKAADSDETECNELLTQIEEQKQKVDEIRKNAEVKSVDIEQEVTRVQLEWNTAAEKIDMQTLEVFKRTADTYDGEALAKAEQQDERTGVYSCGGCYMRTPDETINQLMTNDDLIRCSNCSRILVLDQADDPL
jgi:predicted  nucleic acid-binding Zn-ribbon protein